MARTVAIIGAGLGGLAAAARLAHDGFDVRVFEKESVPGGRCGTQHESGFTWDIGPTMLLFPDVLREHFAAVGEDPAEWLTLSACDPNYRIHFTDGRSLTMSTDLRAMQRELESFAKGSFDGLLRFLTLAQKQKEIAFSTFLARTFDHPAEMFGPKELMGLVRSKAYRSLHGVVSSMIADPHLRMALTFQTMYLGLSPFKAPALFGLLPCTEFVDGIWYAKGGLSAIATALEGVAKKKGARFEYGCAVSKIQQEGSKAKSVVLADGRVVTADVVLANADLPYVYRELLDAPSQRAKKFTSSALVFLLGCDRSWSTVLHHNVLFGHDYKNAFDDIFARGRVPASPSFYVANPAATDASMAPAGKSALYVLVPVPHLKAGGVGSKAEPGEIDWKDERVVSRVRETVFDRIDRTIAPGLRDSIEVERTITPLDWRSRFSLEHGSAFGLAHTIDQVGAMRPPNRHSKLGNLYFVGASTQPATGIPNVLIGARHVADRIRRESAP